MERSDQNYPVAVLGATGKVGSQVLHYLRDAGIPCRALTRTPQHIKEYPGVEWIRGDLADEQVMTAFLKGCKKLFLNSGVTPAMVTEQCRIIDIAKSEGLEQVIKLSTPAARPDAPDPVGVWHWHIEEHLKASGLLWNSLQPQSFMQNWLGDFARTIKSERKIYSTAGSGKRAFTDTRDIGKVALRLFETPGPWKNRVVPLSGKELVSFYEVADSFSKVLGDTVTYVPQSEEQARERFLKHKVPDFLIHITLTIERNQKEGLVEQFLTGNVKAISGEEPFSAYDFARDYMSYFR